MKRLHPIALALLLVSVATVMADTDLDWPAQDKLPKNVTLHAAGKLDKQAVVEVKAPADKAVQLLEVADPKVPSHRYMLKGKVKYKGVDKDAYVEMWSHFADDKAYFSRTLKGDQGPLAKIQGDSDWRTIELPFTSEPGKLPTKLVVKIVLPGEGTVYFTPFTLTSIGGAAAAWWSEPSAGLVGGIGGGLLGSMGAVIGVLAGCGAARKLVVGLCIAIIAVGALSLITGGIALLMGQPWYVYYPFLLGGVIGVAVCGFNLPALRRRYDALELRRMTALDA